MVACPFFFKTQLFLRMGKVLVNWSGGKDSSLCLHHLSKSDKYEVVGLLTVSAAYNRVSMHGTRESLIEKQAEAIGIPLHFLRIPEKVTMSEYNQLMMEALQPFKNKGIKYCAFGDIFLEDLRIHREEKLAEINMEGLFPLWNQSTQKLAEQFIDEGFRAVISSLNGNKLDRKFAGRTFDDQFLKDLPADVDPCGEYGEFHTFVWDGPIFNKTIPIKKGKTVERVYEPSNSESASASDSFSHHADQSSSFWFIDLQLL